MKGGTADTTGLSPDKKEIIGTMRIVSLVGVLGSILGVLSDLEFVQERHYPLVIGIRLFYVCFLLLLAWLCTMRPRIILRYHIEIVVSTVVTLYLYLTWLDVASGDFSYSGYYRSMIQVSLSLLVFRTLPLLIQGGTVLLGLLIYTIVISSVYDLDLAGSTRQETEFLYIFWDVSIIYLILALVFQSYARSQQEELRLREALRRANEAKSNIIAKVNHELQTPLLGILNNLENMRRFIRNRDLSRITRATEKSTSYCMYQRTLVNNMISASATENREAFHVDKNESSGLRSAFRQAMGLVRDIHDGDIEAAEAPDVWIPCQSEILMIILVNLLANCAEHSARTQLTWKREAASVLMFTENETITPVDIEAMFQPWTTTRKDKTKPILGLGLNIAYTLVKKIGGDIQAREERNYLYLELRLPTIGLRPRRG